MQAGRELDAIVAEKVMGWTKRDAGGWWDAECFRCVGPTDATHGAVGCKFSTDMSAAWQVWDEMKKDSERWDKFVWEIASSPECGGIIDTPTPDLASVFAAITPLSICLAALKVAEPKAEIHK